MFSVQTGSQKLSLGVAGNYPFREPFANHELAMFYDLRGQAAARMQLERSQNLHKTQL